MMRTFAGLTTWLVTVCTVLALSTTSEASSNVDVRVRPQTVELGETFRYEIAASTVGNNRIRVTRRPDFPSQLRVVGTSNSPRFVLRNGRAQRSLTTVYRVRAEELGKFEIKGPSVQIGAKTHKGKDLAVKVVDRGDAPSASRDTSRSNNKNKELFVDYAMRPKHESFVGEQITLAYYLFTGKMGVSSAPQPPDEPSLDDFWIEDLSQKVSGRRETVQVDGKFMHRTGLRAYALFPLRAGTTTIEPLSVKVRVGGFLTNRRVMDVASDPIEMEVLPLPPDAPDSFYDGNVGSWEFRVTTDKMNAEVGEPIRIRVTAEGAGQVSRIQLPPLPDIENARVAGRDEQVDMRIDQMTVRGNKTMEYTLVPTAAGSIEIPALEFSYFNPDVEKYRTRRSEPLTISARPGGKDLTAQPAPKPEAEEETTGEESVLETIIGQLRPPTNAIESPDSDGALLQNPFYWIALVIPLLGLVFLALEPFVRRWRTTDTPTRTRKKAAKKAREWIETARDAAESEALDALHRALETYFVDALGIRRTRLSEEELAVELAECGAASELCERAGRLLAEINTNRYAPGASVGQSDIERLADEVEALIDDLESGRSRGDISAAAAAAVLGVCVVAGALLAPAPALAQTEPDQTSDVLESAREAQDRGDWDRAASTWATLAEAHPESAEVQFNLGTALAHAGDYGRARLALERAALLAPQRHDIGQNRDSVERIVRLRQIEEARGTVRENTTSEGLFWWRLAGQTPQNSFPLAVALFVWVALVFGVLARIREHDGAQWETWAAIVAVAFAAVSATGIAARSAVLDTVDPAVVVDDSPTLREGPSEHAAQKRVSTVLVPGVMLPVVETRNGWVQFEFADGTRAWLARSEVEYVEAQEP